MKTGLLNPKHHFRVGPGGWNCPCCGPAPKHRKAAARQHKRQVYRMLDKFENQANS